MCFNCRSIRNKTFGVMSYVVGNNIDLAILQETWLKKADRSIIAEIKEYGYDVISYRRSRRHEGGGVAIIYKSNLNVQRVKSRQNYKSFEHVECLVRTKDHIFRLVNIYRAEYSLKHKVTANMFFEEFSEFTGQILAIPGDPIIAGDLNFHVECPEKDPEAQKFLQLLDDYDLQQLVHHSTHEKGGTLDLVITPKNQDLKEYTVEEDRLESDHNPVIFSIRCDPEFKNEKITITTRDLKNLNLTDFKEDLQNSAIYTPNKDLSLEEAVTLYNSTLTAIINKHCPQSTKRIRPRPLQQWYSDSLRALKRSKRAAERKWRKSKTAIDKEQYKTLQKLYNSSIKEARVKHFRESFLTDKHNIKRTFKIFNRLTGDSYKCGLPANPNKQSLANDMTSFFSDKINTIRTQITAEKGIATGPDDIIKDFEDEDCSPPILSTFTEITENDIKIMVNNMNSKFNSMDPIPTWLVKSCLPELQPILLLIINKSLDKGIFPLDLKHATIRPLLKDSDEDPEIYKNYRPISNTPFLAKLLEKAALIQLNKHIELNNLHSKFQSGYKKYHSCETALIKIVNDIQIAVENRNMVALLLLDLSAAFDTVDHGILKDKLQKDFGFTDTVINWISSYLSNRTFSVLIEDKQGLKLPLLFGVPQGSLLGPLLFILYTKDLGKIAQMHGLSIHIYADDTQIYISFKPISEKIDTISRIENCLNDIKVWMTNNFLKLNADKTKLLFIGSSTNTTHHNSLKVQCHGQELSNSKAEKTLGVFLDSNLTMEENVKEICKASYFHLRNMGRIKKCLDTELRILLVKSFVLSKLDFCNGILANIPVHLMNKLQSVQNSCIRFIYNIKRREHVSQYLLKAHFLPVRYRIKYKLCLQVFNILNGISPCYLKDLVQPQVHRRANLRSENDAFLLDARNLLSGTIAAKMTLYWNDLPYVIRSCELVTKFKKDLKTHYINEAFALV